MKVKMEKVTLWQFGTGAKKVRFSIFKEGGFAPYLSRIKWNGGGSVTMGAGKFSLVIWY